MRFKLKKWQNFWLVTAILTNIMLINKFRRYQQQYKNHHKMIKQHSMTALTKEETLMKTISVVRTNNTLLRKENRNTKMLLILFRNNTIIKKENKNRSTSYKINSKTLLRRKLFSLIEIKRKLATSLSTGLEITITKVLKIHMAPIK